MQEHDQPSYLFMLRLWRAAAGEGRSEWQGRIQYVYSNECHDFRDWRELVELLEQVSAEFEARATERSSGLTSATRRPA